MRRAACMCLDQMRRERRTLIDLKSPAGIDLRRFLASMIVFLSSVPPDDKLIVSKAPACSCAMRLLPRDSVRSCTMPLNNSADTSVSLPPSIRVLHSARDRKTDPEEFQFDSL